MGKSLLYFLLLISLVTQLHPCSASEIPHKYINIYSQYYSTRHGLPSNHVSHVSQDRSGRIWVCTQSGIASYDGQSFQSYETHFPKQSNVFFNHLYHDSRDRIWIGTTDGAAHFDHGKVINIPLKWGDEIPIISTILEDDHGHIWALCNRQELRRLDDRSLDRANWETKPDRIIITRIRRGIDGKIWLGTSDGFYRLENGNIKKIELKQDISILDFTFRDDRGMWVIDDSGNVFELTKNSADLIKTFTLPENAGRTVYDLAVSHSEGLWIATFRGLYLWQHNQLKNFRYRNGLSSNVIMDVFLDQEGCLWYGSDNGLGKIPGLMFRRLMPSFELPISSVTGICEDAHNRTWLSVNEGLIRINGNDVKIWTLKDGIRDESIYAVKAYKDSVIFTNAYGVFEVDDSDKINLLADDEKGFFLNATTQGDSIWLMSEDGLFKYSAETGVRSMNHLFPVEETISVDCVFFDSRGWMWVATDGYGLFVQKEPDQASLIPVTDLPCDRVFSIYEDATGSIWAGTLKGVSLVREEKVTQTFGIQQGLQSEDIWTVLTDRNNGIWVSTSKGISSIFKGRILNYDYNDGLSGEDFIANCRHIDSQGRLWFGGMGVTIVDPEENMPDKAPLTSFRYARLNGKPLDNFQRISPGRNTFEFGLMCSSYRNETQNLFRYQLVGYDDFRSEATRRSEIRYTNLPRGSYTLLAESCNRDGKWSEKPVSISFEVLPAWYQKEVVWLLGVLILVLIMRLILRFRSYQLAKTTIRLQEEVRRQTRVIQKQMERLEEQKNLMEEQAKIDDLTKLHNRRHFYRKLREAWIVRRIEGTPLSLIVFDLDHFKQINDTFGHLTGDAVLRKVSSEIKKRTPINGLVARYGGEEIVLMLTNTALDSACEIAENIRRAVESLDLGSDDQPDLVVTISGGVSCRVGQDISDSPDALIREADEALYKAKAAGRNCIRMFELST